MKRISFIKRIPVALKQRLMVAFILCYWIVVTVFLSIGFVKWLNSF